MTISYQQHLLALRIAALGQDGYEVIYSTSPFPHYHVIKLRHRNGNTITLFVDYILCTMRQFSNHRLVYDGDISA